MDFVGLIKNAFEAIASVFGYAKQRDAEKNAPDMVQAKEAATETAALDQTRTALAKKDLDELRREAAE
jgi:hypothetical protein